VPDEDHGPAGRTVGDHAGLAQVIRRARRDSSGQIGNGYRVSGCGQIGSDWLPGLAADERAVDQQQPSLHALIRITDAAQG
jgi:hypothetical protein